jgi:hypothetical protein
MFQIPDIGVQNILPTFFSLTILLIFQKNKKTRQRIKQFGLVQKPKQQTFPPCLTNDQKVQISVIPIELSGSGLFPGDAGCLQIPANYDNFKI